MGRKNADRIPISEYRGHVVGVEDMQRHGWQVISHCTSCGLSMVVDLELVARISGPGTMLWNRKSRCRKIGCAGWVNFQAKLPGVGFYQVLSADDRERL